MRIAIVFIAAALCGFVNQRNADAGFMHCCIRWKGECKCYSTFDGDCSPCLKIGSIITSPDAPSGACGP